MINTDVPAGMGRVSLEMSLFRDSAFTNQLNSGGDVLANSPVYIKIDSQSSVVAMRVSIRFRCCFRVCSIHLFGGFVAGSIR